MKRNLLLVFALLVSLVTVSAVSLPGKKATPDQKMFGVKGNVDYISIGLTGEDEIGDGYNGCSAFGFNTAGKLEYIDGREVKNAKRNAKGQLISFNLGDSKFKLTYNSAGKVVSSIEQCYDSSVVHTSYSYDKAGNLIKSIAKNGKNEIVKKYKYTVITRKNRKESLQSALLWSGLQGNVPAKYDYKFMIEEKEYTNGKLTFDAINYFVVVYRK